MCSVFATETLAQRITQLGKLGVIEHGRRGYRCLDYVLVFSTLGVKQAGDFRQQDQAMVFRQHREELGEQRINLTWRDQHCDQRLCVQARVAEHRLYRWLADRERSEAEQGRPLRQTTLLTRQGKDSAGIGTGEG